MRDVVGRSIIHRDQQLKWLVIETCGCKLLLRRGKTVRIDSLFAELLILAPAIFLELLLALIHKTWESETFANEWKKGIIIKIPKKGTRLECDNRKGIFMLRAVAGILDNIILGWIKEHLESLIDRE